MSNPLLNLIAHAAERDWCTTPWCTTCGSREYRTALQMLGGRSGEPLRDALCALEPEDLVRIPGWAGALQIALTSLPGDGQIEWVLEAWTPKIGRVPRFDDAVFSRISLSLDATAGRPVSECFRDYAFKMACT